MTNLPPQPIDAPAFTELPDFIDKAEFIELADEAGQTTAEYALVLVAAATIALLVVAWAGDTGAIGGFFDTIIERITQMIP